MRPGEAPDWPLDLPPDERALGPDGLLFKYLGGLMAAVGDPTAPDWPSADLLAYDALSLAAYLQQAGASPGGILNLVGEGLESLSLLCALRHLAGLYGGGQTYLIEGGADRLPRAFAADLGERIRYETPVTSIAYGPDGASVTYLDNGQPRSLSGDYLICTIPCPVLRELPVQPPFSSGKTRAIQELATTSVTRIYLQTRERVWERLGLPAGASTDGPLGVCTDLSALQPGPHAVIESYQAGAAAHRSGARLLAEQLARTASAMDALYPGIDAARDGGAAYAWHEDQWARGGYAWSRPGDMTTLEPHVGTPEGRVYFAGDHASPWPGWMQGALWSGLRAAQAIIAVSKRG